MRPMKGNDYLPLQANIICLLLALIGSTVIIQHPGWFGGVPAAGKSEGQERQTGGLNLGASKECDGRVRRPRLIKQAL